MLARVGAASLVRRHSVLQIALDALKQHRIDRHDDR